MALMPGVAGVGMVLLVAGLSRSALPAWEALWERSAGLAPKASVTLTLADLDGDRADDAVVLAGGRLVGVWRVLGIDGRTGRVLWERREERRTSSAVSDLDGDGRAEVVAATGETLRVLRGADGRVLRAVRLRAPVGEVTTGEFDGDGTLDVVYTAGAKEHDDVLVALSGRSWRELWVRTTEPDDGPMGGGFGALTVLDAGGGGGAARRDEVLVTERRNELTCVDGGGAVLWSVVLGRKTRYLPEGVVSGAPAIVALAGGGTGVAVGCFAGALVVLDGRSGRPISRLQFGLDAHERFARDRRLPRFLREIVASTGEPLFDPIAVELDGEPGDELVFGSSDGRVYAASPGRGEALWSFECESDVNDRCFAVPTSEAQLVAAWDVEATYVLDGATGRLVGRLPLPAGSSAAALGDVNADGVLDVVAVPLGGESIHAWTTGIAAP